MNENKETLRQDGKDDVRIMMTMKKKKKKVKRRNNDDELS